jgi:hypothetical protein
MRRRFGTHLGQAVFQQLAVKIQRTFEMPPAAYGTTECPVQGE